MVASQLDPITMARKPNPPVTYGDDVSLSTTLASQQPGIRTEDSISVAKESIPEEGRVGGRRPILDQSAPTLVYLHPAGKHQLRSYAVAQGLKVKVHDLLLEALEEWGQRRGLTGPWRVPPSKPRR